MSDLGLVQGDTAPSVFGHLTNTDGTDKNLTGSTVRFQMRSAIDRRFVVNAIAVIVDATTGSVRYDWQAGDLAEVGEFVTRWQITYSDNTVEHTDPENTLTVAAQ